MDPGRRAFLYGLSNSVGTSVPANDLPATDHRPEWLLAEADVVVQVDRRRNLYAPTIFSPNGDGENDRFLLFGRGVAEIQTLRIFDRWGNQLYLNEHFQPNEESEGWDGRFRGQDMNPGVFVWQAVIKFVDGAVEVYAGDVTLYR